MGRIFSRFPLFSPVGIGIQPVTRKFSFILILFKFLTADKFEMWPAESTLGIPLSYIIAEAVDEPFCFLEVLSLDDMFEEFQSPRDLFQLDQ